MGFLEELRKEKAMEQAMAEEKSRRERRERIEREVAKAEIRKADEERKARILQSAIESKKQFYESGLGDLINELSEVCGAGVEERSEAPMAVGDIGAPRNNRRRQYFNYKVSNNDLGKHVCEVNFPGEPYSLSFFRITTTPDGTIIFEGGKINKRTQLKITINKNKWKGNRDVLEDALGRVYGNPIIHRFSLTGSSDRDIFAGGGPCLPGNALINTSSGFVLVKNLKSGDLVWTADGFGQRVQAVIVQAIKRVASKYHKMEHIVLKDGRELIVSPGHPTIENVEIGSLKTGQILDKSQIVSIRIMPYKEKYTYDILPAGETGGYWANNILIGSTLSNQFKQTLNFAY